MSTDFKFQIDVRIDGKSVTGDNLFRDTYQLALNTLKTIIDSKYNTQKNDHCNVWIYLVKILYDDGVICDVVPCIKVYEKFIHDEKPIKRYYLNGNWLLCYKKYGNRLIEGVVTERLLDGRYVFKAFKHTGRDTGVFRKPEIVHKDKIVWQREGD